jgi:hypothetical protein
MDVEEVGVDLGAEGDRNLLKQIGETGVLHLLLVFLADLVAKVPEIQNKGVVFALEKGIDFVLQLPNGVLALLPPLPHELDNRILGCLLPPWHNNHTGLLLAHEGALVKQGRVVLVLPFLEDVPRVDALPPELRLVGNVPLQVLKNLLVHLVRETAPDLTLHLLDPLTGVPGAPELLVQLQVCLHIG